MRGYNRVTPEIEARVIAVRETNPTTGYADLAEIAGLPERTIKYVLTDLPRLRRVHAGEDKAQGSLKGRVYEAIKGVGHIKDVTELRRIVGMADDEHSVLHVLHSLHTQGRIDFDERGNGMGTATAVNIRLHKKNQKVRLSPDPEAVPEIVTLKLPVISREQEERELSASHLPDTYPFLDDLLDREAKRIVGDSKGYAYITAADAIQGIDPEQAAVLMEKAKTFDIPFPSPLEAEYLRYVATHPNKENHE